MGKSRPPAPETPPAPFNSPFARLAGKLGATPVAAGAADPPSPAAPASAAVSQHARSADPARAPARAVVRLERKGRGGKEATVVEKLELPARELETWLVELKRGLGCGGQLEGDALVLHGDLRTRVKPWLEARGVRKVTLG